MASPESIKRLLKKIIKAMKMHRNTPYKPDPDSGWKYGGVPVPRDRTTPMSHSGRSVFTHSIWTVFAILNWFKQKCGIVEGIDLKETLWAAFLHDISKGTHCAQTCMRRTCFIDAYGQGPYDGQDDSKHPKYSGDIIAGRYPMLLQCPKSNDKNANTCSCAVGESCQTCKRDHYSDWMQSTEKTYLPASFFTHLQLNQAHLAVIGAMHWELGNVNMGKITPEQYVQKFLQACRTYGAQPSVRLLKELIAVSFADVRAGDVVTKKYGTRAWCAVLGNIDPLLRQVCKSTGEVDLLPYYKGRNAFKTYYNKESIVRIRKSILRAFKQAKK